MCCGFSYAIFKLVKFELKVPDLLNPPKNLRDYKKTYNC